MALDSALDTALKGAAPIVVLMVRIDFPDGTLRLLDGAGQVVFDGATWFGEDATYGTLDGVETISDQVGTEAPMIRLTLLPASLGALAAITNPVNQNSLVRVWLGSIDPVTGALIGVPESLFMGVVDTADVDVDKNRTVIVINVASAWERLFEANEAQRLNNSFIQSLYPGALGASFVIAIQRNLPWGYDAPRPAVVSDVLGGVPDRGQSPAEGGGGGGGGYGGGDYYDRVLF
jgi:hypothetical protein